MNHNDWINKDFPLCMVSNAVLNDFTASIYVTKASCICLCLCVWCVLVNQIIFLSITFITMAAYIYGSSIVCVLWRSDRLLNLAMHFCIMGVLMWHFHQCAIRWCSITIFSNKTFFYKGYILMASLMYVFSGD